MEIVTAPYRPTTSTWTRLLVAGCVLAPVTLLAMLPVGLGLNRYVITGDAMSPSLDRGSVVLAREVPVADLRVGDVVTFDPPASSGVAGPVTSRIVSIEAGAIHTRRDASSELDPWALPLNVPSQDRVVAELPYVGYLYLVLLHAGQWAAVAVLLLGALVIALVADRGRRRAGRRTSRGNDSRAGQTA